MTRLSTRLMILAPLLAIVAPAVFGDSASCHAVEGDRITAGDLAAVLPVFAAIPPETPFGYAPQPGAYRNIEPAELTRFAMAHGLAFHGIDTVCFEPALHELHPLVVEESIRESLQAMAITEAEIEVIDYSKFRVPSGKLSFPVESLPAYSSANTAMWNGFVEHERHRYPVWARVRIMVAQRRVVASVALRAGQSIEAGDLRVEEVNGFPVRPETLLKSVSDGAGMLAKRYLNAGTPVNATDLMPPWDVDRGDMVTVRVESGGAVLTLQAEAQADGRAGQSIAFRNAGSGKIFHAKITGRGRALVECRAAGV